MKLDKLFQSLLLTGVVVVLLSTPARSEKTQDGSSTATVEKSALHDAIAITDKEFVSSKSPVLASSNRKILQLSQIPQVSQSAELLVQSPASSEVIQVTGVQANPTEQGVEVILQTTQGEQLQITNRSTENNFIADIPNAQLRLPSGDGFTFRSQNPVEGITEITVTNIDANTIRVTVAGETGLPSVEFFDGDEGLIFALKPAAIAVQPGVEQPMGEIPPEESSEQEDELIELVVTAEQQDTGYRVPNVSTATRTDTPLRDIPQSIQVVPQQVIKDQQAVRLEDALRNATGTTSATNSAGSTRSEFNIRGFRISEFSGNFLRNGLRDNFASSGLDLSNVERIEVLLGPASVLFGGATPGGTINIITKQPLRNPYYSAGLSIGNYDFYRAALDISGPLNDSRTLLYRLNASYQDRGTFTDFSEIRTLSIASVINWIISDNTKLIFEGDFSDFEADRYIGFGLPAIGTVLPNPNGDIPRNRNFNEGSNNIQVGRIGYRLEHSFSDNWSLLNAFRYGFYRGEDIGFNRPSSLLPDNRTLERTADFSEIPYDNYNFTTNITGRFSTGSIEHQLLLGFDLDRLDQPLLVTQRSAAPIDLFNPVYGQPLGPVVFSLDQRTQTNSLGIYVQDMVSLTNNLKLLLGLRFDAFEQTQENFIANTQRNQSGEAFSPRFGLVYQLIEPISLYASYSRSFNPAIGTSFDGSIFQPERGTQYEIGVKADINDRLFATLAFYDLTRSNILTSDPINPTFSIQTGEQNSRGIELNFRGEILPGWNMIAGYSYIDAKVTEDPLNAGNRLNNTPRNALNLWTTYEIQQGTLQGLGFGLGLFFVGERQGDLANTFELPSYLRTDAAIFYKRERFRAAINLRNLFDANYFETSLNRLGVIPGEPFSVQGTISWEF
ncbi:TonB-dependent siderophore receptor [Gloeocapsopsis dulcis]|uniref:TonB-dependent siderophore receptor n=1 Tax=Gloeocapsopsis dulcis AAB1 = 1H9 TaxID=1433147 RepID=A0A6N8G2C1_9CHRO|nr:TonB-dependent siderophore receptor [Gloeocapsopsis dulcis]MUL39558.1 TonB-dependent siderophore receptor [Gloeocapsopsis dulcis AAB1 = 1H9]WNN92280.1 TonB-dependent siderophore receptor [Gloeocapsopsis dulcis]